MSDTEASTANPHDDGEGIATVPTADANATGARAVLDELVAMGLAAAEQHGVSLGSLLATVIQRVHGIDLHARVNKDGGSIGPKVA